MRKKKAEDTQFLKRKEGLGIVFLHLVFVAVFIVLTK